MDALFFGRVDYQELAQRRERHAAEFIWRASPSLGVDAQVFTGLTGQYSGSYCWPSGFSWGDSGDAGSDPPIETNPDLETFNVRSRVDDFVRVAAAQASLTRGHHIMFTMGCDFNYENSEAIFERMDKLIAAVNNDGRVQARYSTPSEYVSAKRAEPSISWPLTNGSDFFPYADVPHAYWSGYFTSRPALKGYARTSSALLNGVRQMQALAGSVGRNISLQPLEDAVGILQHHDALSGTARQHVAFDYSRRLSRGTAAADTLVSTSLALLLQQPTTTWLPCSRLNESVCEATDPSQSDSSAVGVVRVAVWNQMGQARWELLRLPVSSDQIEVRELGSAVLLESQVYQPDETVTNYARDTRETTATAAFIVPLPAAGVATFEISQGKPLRTSRLEPLRKSGVASTASLNSRDSGTKATGRGTRLTIGNEHVELVFSNASGLLVSMEDKTSGIRLALNQSFCYYSGTSGEQGAFDQGATQASGPCMIQRLKPSWPSVDFKMPTIGCRCRRHLAPR